MIFRKVDHYFQSEHGVSLHDLIYRLDLARREYILHQFVNEFPKSLNDNNYFYKVIRLLVEQKNVAELYNFLRYYTEFPIFTAEKTDGKVLSDYRYIAGNFPTELWDVTDSLNIECHFNTLEIENGQLHIDGYAFIPFINHETQDDIQKKLILKIDGADKMIPLNNIKTDQTLNLGNGVYYYEYSGFNKVIQLNEDNDMECFIELITKEGLAYRNYCFEIIDKRLTVDIEKQKSQNNQIFFKSSSGYFEPELISAEPEDNKLNLFIMVHDDTVDELLEEESHTQLPVIRIGEHEVEMQSIKPREYSKFNIRYTNKPMLMFQVDTSLFTEKGRSYLVYKHHRKNLNVKYAQSQIYVLNKVMNQSDDMAFGIFSNKKNNIELHVQENGSTQKSKPKFMSILKKIKSRF